MTLSVLAWPKQRNRQENPYNYLVYRDMDKDISVTEFNYRAFDVGKADILHVHWPDRLLDDKRKWRLVLRFKRFLKAIKHLHRRGGKLVWTVHNLRSREIQYPELADKYLKQFIAETDGLIFLSEASQRLFTEIYGLPTNVRTVVIPHPHYRDVYQSLTLPQAKLQLSMQTSKFVLGFFGKIRVNKGLDALIQSLDKNLAGEIKLLLAGGPDKRGMSPVLSRHLAENKETVAIIRYIEPDEVGSIVCACNALIFPYQDILNSGSAILALSLGRPIIAPKIGSFPELRDLVGKDWVYLYEQPLDSVKLKDAIAWAKSKDSTVPPEMQFAASSRVARLTGQFYKELFS